MALTKKSENNIVYLEAKYYCLWRGLKQFVAGCEEIEVNNPATGSKVKKYGYSYASVGGHATNLVKYDTGQQYSKRYFGFKLHLVEGNETYIVDMPYASQLLRRFLHTARNFDWNLPLTISIFKGKKKDAKAGAEPTGVWFQQRGETVKPYYTKEQPHGMPEGSYDTDLQQWDFKAQHRWLVDRLQSETIPDIESAAVRVIPPIEAERMDEPPDRNDEGEAAQQWGREDLTDDDVPF